jgi:hypothetical protein
MASLCRLVKHFFGEVEDNISIMAVDFEEEEED